MASVSNIEHNSCRTLTLDEKKDAGERCRLAALDYLNRGWSPLALCPPDHVGVGVEHARKCSSPGKTPWHTWKQHQTEPLSEADINRLWRQNCQSNVGIALGLVSGLIRVDADGETGNRLLEEVSGGDLSETVEFTSGQPGSRGLLFKIPKNEKGEYIKLRTTSLTGEGEHDELPLSGEGCPNCSSTFSARERDNLRLDLRSLP